MAFNPTELTAAQMRAARALLNWRAQDLADRADLGVVTIRRAETCKGPLDLTPKTAEKIVRALEKAGIAFLATGKSGGVGVRLRR